LAGFSAAAPRSASAGTASHIAGSVPVEWMNSTVVVASLMPILIP
jgi:hypothetical protein